MLLPLSRIRTAILLLLAVALLAVLNHRKAAHHEGTPQTLLQAARNVAPASPAPATY